MRGTRTSSAVGLLLLASLAIPAAHADSAFPPDVVVLCAPTLRSALSDVGALWRRQTGFPVILFASPTPLLLEQMGHRIRSDLIVAEGEDAAVEAIRRKLIKPETRFGGWRNRLVVALRRGASLPAQGGSLAALAGDDPIALVDPAVAVAGQDSRAALEHLGVWDGLQKHVTGVVGTADAVFLLTTGKVTRALVYATDVAADPALSVAATLPDDSYPAIRYWVAETSVAQSPNVASFEAFLREPAAQQRLRADGLEVTP
jgi:molybdate transport system substrate-binding protein